MKKIFTLFILLSILGCAGHPITHNPKKPKTAISLKPTSNLLVLTYMSNREAQITVELLNTNHKYYAEIRDTIALQKLLPESLKANLSAKIIPDSALKNSATYKSLEKKYLADNNYINLNEGMLIFSEEDLPLVGKISKELKADATILLRLNYSYYAMDSYSVSLNGIVLDPLSNLVYSNLHEVQGSSSGISDDPLEGAGAKTGAILNALTLTFVHNKTLGIQPVFVSSTKQILNEFFAGFATFAQLETKKKK